MLKSKHDPRERPFLELVLPSARERQFLEYDEMRLHPYFRVLRPEEHLPADLRASFLARKETMARAARAYMETHRWIISGELLPIVFALLQPDCMDVAAAFFRRKVNVVVVAPYVKGNMEEKYAQEDLQHTYAEVLRRFVQCNNRRAIQSMIQPATLSHEMFQRIIRRLLPLPLPPHARQSELLRRMMDNVGFDFDPSSDHPKERDHQRPLTIYVFR